MTLRTALAALLIVPALGRAGAAAEVTTKLKIGIIPTPEVMLSRSDLAASGGRYLSLSRRRGVVPKNDVALGKNPSHSFSIGGAEFTLRLEKKRDFILEAPGGASAKLKRKGASFMPVPVPIPEKRKYVLAFPATYMTAISFRSGSVQKGKIGGKDFALYDDDMDGYYGNEDTFLVGKGCVYAPISKFFATSSSVYELAAIDREGGEVTYSRYAGGTGKLSMKDPSRTVFAQVAFGSKDAGLNLVLSGSSRDSKVLPGTYELLYGLATDRSMKKVYAGVVPGEFSPVEVGDNGKAVAELGGPYRLEFKHRVVAGKLTLSPTTIKLYGKNGEQYVSFDYKGTPTVSIVSEGRIVRSDKMESG